MSAQQQLDLFVPLPDAPPKHPAARAAASRRGRSIDELFTEFHEANPKVYEALVALARNLANRGRKRIGIGMLFEVLRWQWQMRTADAASDFKLNNNYRSRYVRLIEANEPDLSGLFEKRELRSL